MCRTWALWSGLTAAVWAGAAGAAQYTNTSHVVDGAGRWLQGGTLTNVAAIAQPGGVSVTAGGAVANQAGFLNTFLLRPALDSDGDGVPNEADPDNDDDTLGDATEIAGTAFSPVTDTDPDDPDSDDDGAGDAAEAVAGTDPWDPLMFLQIVTVRPVSSNLVEVGWVARSNKTYRVLAEPSVPQAPGFTSELAQVVAGGPGSPPWFVVTNRYTDPAAVTNNLFYRIEALP